MVIEMMFRVAVIMSGFMDRNTKHGQDRNCPEAPFPAHRAVGAIADMN
jgi:hypothetical protein